MKEETMLEVFRISRDLAIADHKHRIERSRAAKAIDMLEGSRSDERSGETPTIHALFVESYRFMTSELSTLKETD